MTSIAIRDSKGELALTIDLAKAQLPVRLVQPDAAEIVPDSTGLATIRALGAGGFGVVVRAVDSLGLERAIKFLKLGPADAYDLLKDEILSNQRNPKKHTAPILSWGRVLDADNVKSWFIVMPYLHGHDLDAFFDQLFTKLSIGEHSSPEILHRVRSIALRVLQQLTQGLEELEHEHLAHMDVLPWNIRIKAPTADELVGRLDTLDLDLSVFLIDLGVARRYGGDGAIPRLPHQVNKHFFPTDLSEAVCVTIGGARCVDPQLLAKLGPRVDLCLLGRVMAFMFNGERAMPIGSQTPLQAEEYRREQWKHVLGDQYEFLQTVASRLRDWRKGSYTSAAQVREILEALIQPRGGAGHDSAVLNDRSLGVRLRIPDTLVNVAPPLHRVVDHPFFQRLRQLKQLAFLDQVYPGGVHTRFTHSLQVFDLMKRYVQALSQDTVFRLEFQRPQVDTLLTAALIHDIGHFPFAHTIEDLRKLGDICHDELPKPTSNEPPEIADKRARLAPLREIKHDHELTERLLRRPYGDWSVRDHKTIADLLQAHDIDVGAACYMFAKTKREPGKRPFEQIGRELVAGIIDADRLSYLKYDSRATGVTYGAGVDVDSLIENLRVFTRRDTFGLGVGEKALPAVEAVLSAVYWMYQNVYWHPRNRAFMAAVKRCFDRCLTAKLLTFEGYWEQTLFMSDHAALCVISDSYTSWLESHIAQADKRFHPLQPLVSGARLPLDAILEVGQRLDLVTQHADLFTVMVKRWSPWEEEALCKLIAIQVFGDDELAEQVLIDMPLKPRLGADGLAQQGDHATSAAARIKTAGEAGDREAELWVHGRDPVSMEEGTWSRLGDRSPFASLLKRLENVEVRKVRVFVSRKLYKRIADRAAVQRSVLKILLAHFNLPQQPELDL